MKYRVTRTEEFEIDPFDALSTESRNRLIAEIKQILSEYQSRLGKDVGLEIACGTEDVFVKMQRLRAKWGTAVVDGALQTGSFRLNADASGYDSIQDIEAAMQVLRCSSPRHAGPHATELDPQG